MKLTIYLCVLFLLFIWVDTPLMAQRTRTVIGNVQGLEDKGRTQLPLPNASIAILNLDDSIAIKGTVSNKDGDFDIRFPSRKGKKYVLKASFMGFQPAFCTLNDTASVIRLGTITLSDEGILMDEVVVTGKLPEVTISKDTTVINATAFKVPEGSELQDLLKRIPGLDYDAKNKKMTYDGKEIKEIAVNGQAFFKNDMQIALENLPADFIGQIKVYDKRSKEELATGVNDGNEHFVLDLKTKKEFENTILTSALIGAGNNDKKELRADMNYFTQSGNNLSVMGRSSNREQNSDFKNKISNSIGLNFVHTWKKKISLNGNAQLFQNRDGNISSSYNETYMKTGNSYATSRNDGAYKNSSFSSNLGFRWEVNEKIEFNIDGGFNGSKSKNAQNSRTATFNKPPGLDLKNPFEKFDEVPDSIKVNNNQGQNFSDNPNRNLDFSGSLTYKLNKKGSNLSFFFQRGDRISDQNTTSENTTTYYQIKNMLGTDSIYYRNQYVAGHSNNSETSGGVSFTQPFNKKIRMQLSYKWKMQQNLDERSTYDLSTQERTYIDSLSNWSSEEMRAHEFGLLFNYTDTIWALNSRFGASPQERRLEQKVGKQLMDSVLNCFDFRGSIDLSYSRKKYRFSFRYDASTTQPPLNLLASFTDNSDPLNITHGNPDLKTGINHGLRVDFRHTKLGLYADVMWNLMQNDVTQYSIYDEKSGGSVSYPVNINGNWYANTNLRWIKSFGKWFTSVEGGMNYSNRVSLVNENQTEQPERSGMHDSRLRGGFRVAFNPKWGGFDVNGSYNFGVSTNTLRDYTNYTRSYDCQLGAFTDLLKNVQLRTNFSYSFQNGTNSQNSNTQELLWNAGVKWRFLKKKQAELEVYWSDILDRANNISRYSSSNGFYEGYQRQQKGYVMATLKYKLRWMK